MLRLVDIVAKTQTYILFYTSEITEADATVYVVFDTSTGASYSLGLTEDYYAWRATSITSTGVDGTYYIISNSNLYPSYSETITDYRSLKSALLTTVTYAEYSILQSVLIRLDLVRRRFPNPGFVVNSTNSIGQNGNVSFSGGYEKKMTVYEICMMMASTIVELNATSPTTSFWPTYISDIAISPYIAYASSTTSIPYDMVELASLGTFIRCLCAWGILEVDLSFQASDSGLQITWDRATHAKGWYDALLKDYTDQKLLFKMNYANHAGVGVGTYAFPSVGIFGTLLNNVTSGGTLAYTSLMGFSSRGNVPM